MRPCRHSCLVCPGQKSCDPGQHHPIWCWAAIILVTLLWAAVVVMYLPQKT